MDTETKQKLEEERQRFRAAKEKLRENPLVQGIATGLDEQGWYMLAVISKKDDPEQIPKEIDGFGVGIRYVEDE
jgi:hypothetical protein